MNNFSNLIDKYKYGIIAAFAVCIAIFMYLQMETYSSYFAVAPLYEDEPVVIPEEKEILLTPEDIQIQQGFHGEVKNASRDMNDTRKRTDENWHQNKSASEVEQSVKDYEKSLFNETGGEAKRKALADEMAKRKQERANTSSSKQKETNSQPGGEKAPSGNVMVDWSLSGRSPHQNNNWYVRNPGYTCGYGSSGRVTISIKVDPNGDVISATYIPAKSSGANSCMIEQATKYARLSRFNYSGSAAKSQEGTIVYTFVSQ